MFSENEWKHLDFGPNTETSYIFYIMSIDEPFLADQFKAFISGVDVDAMKRGLFCIRFPRGTDEVLRSMFLAQIEAFCNATEPHKLFQNVLIFGNGEANRALADRVQEEKILELVRQEPNVRVFREKHPKLKLAMEVHFGPGGVLFKIIKIE